MASFKSTQILRSTKVGEVENPEARYWSRFKSPMVRYEQSSVTHIDYSVRKGQFCTTAGFRIVLCDYASGATVKQLTRFSNRVYGATYGREGDLLACGTDDGVVLALSATSGTQLRSFRGHTGRVRSVAWTSDGLGVVSGSDDRTVRVWDVAGAQQTASFSCFTDSVRCVTIARENGLLLVGSYDHRVRMFDARLPESSALVAELDCGAPVEALCAFERPAPFAFAAACGNSVRSFDLRTRQPLAAACAHHKSVTALAFAPCTAALGDVGEAEGGLDAEARSYSSMRLFSASLDGHVRIYDAATLAPTFKFSYSSAVLSLRVAEDDGLIVGMQNGLIALQRRQRVDAQVEGARVSQPVKSRTRKSDDGDEEQDEELQRRVRQPKELQGSIAERVDQALFRAMGEPNTTSAQLDAIFAELNGTQSRAGKKRARLDQDQEAARALTANEDRLDELVLRARGRAGQPMRVSRWDKLLARFEHRKCFELVFGTHFDWLNRHRPELVFCIVRELLRRNVLDNCLCFRCRVAPTTNSQAQSPRRLTTTRPATTAKNLGERDEMLLRNVLSFIAAHSSEVRYERVLLALCRHVAAVPNLPALLAHGGKRTLGLFRSVHNTIARQLDFVKQAHVVSGMIDTLLCDAAARASTTAQPALDTP